MVDPSSSTTNRYLLDAEMQDLITGKSGSQAMSSVMCVKDSNGLDLMGYICSSCQRAKEAHE